MDIHISGTCLAVSDERERQDAQWGGPAHDDTHTQPEWCSYILKQVSAALAGPDSGFRSRMIKIAALAIAAVEAQDRVRNKRHHDMPYSDIV